MAVIRSLGPLRERPSPHWHISEQRPPFTLAITRLLARDNEVAISWVPAQQGIQANERADEIAKTTAEGRSPSYMVTSGKPACSE